MTKTPDFQETLKRMLNSPPKENKPLHEARKKKDGDKPRQKLTK